MGERSTRSRACRAIGVAIETSLTPHQGTVFVAITLDDVPVDADRIVPGMATHQEGCPACHEDRETLAGWLDHLDFPD